MSRTGADWLYVVSMKETGHALEPGNVVVVEKVEGQRVENSIWTVIRNGVGLALASESALRADISPISIAQIEKDLGTSIKYLAIGFAGRM